MHHNEVHQLELLSSIDALRSRVNNWIEMPTPWAPISRCQLLLRRVAGRIETLRIRMEAPLVVATFGGTGTGKSSLVNALVGADVTRSGRQRPTTQRPILIAHPQTSLADLGIPLDEVDVVLRDADLLRDIILLDCPDPDTTEDGTPDSNLERLRTLLPYCDILLYVSTQQKYRSARVADELKTAASGCRILFVQTHADLDVDIREDWQKSLATEYDVPEVFFVDSVKALQDQLAGRQPVGDMGRLIDLLRNHLGVSERVRVRRANVLELFHAGLNRCETMIADKEPALETITKVLAAQQGELTRRLATQLQEELLTSRRIWERRLIGSVLDRWTLTPFSCVLRSYQSLGNLIASSMLFRARSAAQLAVLGTVQGLRWAEDQRQEKAATNSLQRLAQPSLDDAVLREAEIVIRGHVAEAGLDLQLIQHRSFSELRSNAVNVETEFLTDASRRIDEIIQDQAKQHSSWWSRLFYDVILSAYLGFVLYRVGKNFFYDSFLHDAPLLSADFYIAAALFLLLICGLLVIRFTSRLQAGLTTRIRKLTERLVQTRIGQSLFPQLEDGVQTARHQAEELRHLTRETVRLRDDLAAVSKLGYAHLPSIGS